MPGQNDCTHFKLSQVLRAEFEDLRPKKFDPKFAPPSPTNDETKDRKELYGFALDKLQLSALALSGWRHPKRVRSAWRDPGTRRSQAVARL
jgi:hypothetical protein